MLTCPAIADALSTVETFASTVAAKPARNDRDVERRTTVFLIDRSHLLKIQAKHLKDEHALRLGHLRKQLREENLSDVGLRPRVRVPISTAPLATAIAIGMVVMINDAVSWRGVVIGSFDGTPAQPETS